MAGILDPTIAEAFCALSDIEQESRITYGANTQPTRPEALRDAVKTANKITAWLAARSISGQTPAAVSETSVEGLLARDLNACWSAENLLRQTDARNLDPSQSTREELREKTDEGKAALLDYYGQEIDSIKTLATDITDGTTAPRTELSTADAEDLSTWIKHDTRF